MMDASDHFGAFMPDGKAAVQPHASGPLTGTTFAAKDVFDVAGRATSAGNPTRGVEVGTAQEHAAAVATLLDTGATLIGKTVTDEFAYGIMGTNPHYGSPRNPTAPGHFCGGSSCGSAAAVAAGSCDFALGTDTGGSIRIPASYCGLFGHRPTHGRVSTEGVVPLAPGFDTVGWLAADAHTLERVGRALLGPATRPAEGVRRVLVASDAFALLTPEAEAALKPIIERCSVETHAGTIRLAGPVDTLEKLYEAYRAVQRHEAWASHGRWVDSHPGALGPMAAERFKEASRMSAAEARAGAAELRRYAKWLRATLDPDTVVCLPTTPGPAPPLDASASHLSETRQRLMWLACPAPAAGAPQVSLPLGTVGTLPLGMSFMGLPGTDEAILAYATKMAID